MMKKHLFTLFLLMLCTAPALRAQFAADYFVGEQRLSEIEGPYCVVQLFRDTLRRQVYPRFYVAVFSGEMPETDWRATRRRSVRNAYLSDEQRRPVIVKSMIEALNLLHGQGWRMVGVSTHITGGGESSVDTRELFFLEKMKP